MPIGYIGGKAWLFKPLALVCGWVLGTFLIESASLAADSKLQQNYAVVDVQSVTASSPQSALRRGTISKPDYTIDCDVLICGGGVGGVAAAWAAAQPNAKQSLESESAKPGPPPLKVCLTEETDWIGGQMTAQGVAALDENYLVETSGACKSYQDFRSSLRAYYKTTYELSAEAAREPFLNPGNCWVTRLSFEPMVAENLLYEMLKPALDHGHLSIYTRMKPIYVRFADGTIRSEPAAAAGDGKKVSGVGMLDLNKNEVYEFRLKLCLDATEFGDLLPLAQVPYRLGSDSRSNTGEAHAPEKGDPQNVQDFTYPFVLDFLPGQHHTIEKPSQYDELNARGKFSFQGYKMFDRNVPGLPGSFWEYRRLLAKENFPDQRIPRDLSMINWDSNDVRGYNLIDQPAAVQAEHLALGKIISLCFLYWLQTEAPRDDGGKGYPELHLRTDVLGSSDGLSKFPYIREARRIVAVRSIVEKDIVEAENPNARAQLCADSVGIGLYPVDIHGHQEVGGAGQSTRPFQIPLGALISAAHASNVLPACKNIGVTHITNGSYRLHPVEWAIGEAQGRLCRLLLERKQTPFQLLSGKSDSVAELQRLLVRGGAPVFWFDDVPTDHPHFEAIQMSVLQGFIPIALDHLHFFPEAPVTRIEAAQAIVRARHKEVEDSQALSYCIKHRYLQENLQENENVQENEQGILSPEDLDLMRERLHVHEMKNREPLTRAHLAAWLTR